MCVYNHCYDGVKDANETGVDCGGGTCSPCATGSPCNTNADCSTDACDVDSLFCVSSQCEDGQQDGEETDVDCGGPACNPCLLGAKCDANFDCEGGLFCSSTTHLCT